MSGTFPGQNVSVLGCDALKRKQLKLYGREHPDVRLFFYNKTSDYKKLTGNANPAADLIVVPSDALPSVFNVHELERLKTPPVIAFGPPSRMRLSIAAGCRDFLCEPWSAEEFFARTVMARSLLDLFIGGSRLIPLPQRKVALVNDTLQAEVLGTAALSSSEYELFCIFRKNKASYLDRATINAVLNKKNSPESRAADMCVSRLRKKIEKLAEDCMKGKEPGEVIHSAEGRGWAMGL